MYDAPRANDPTPRAVGLFRVYGWTVASIYGLAAALLVVNALRADVMLPATPPLVGVLLLFGGAHGVAAGAPRLPWAWTMSNVLLVLGSASCLLPLALPLLLAWQKPLVKALYRRV